MIGSTVDLQKKSADTLKAAEKLIAWGLLNPSFHCSYYSCLQLSKFFLLEIAKVQESELEPERNDQGIYINRHEVIIRKVKKWLKDHEKDIVVYSHISMLKQKRVEADYTTEDFNRLMSQTCYDKAAKVTTFLNGVISEKLRVD